jgi:hypothetical protein
MIEALMRRCDESVEDALPVKTLPSSKKVIPARPTRRWISFRAIVASPCGWLRQQREKLRTVAAILETRLSGE